METQPLSFIFFWSLLFSKVGKWSNIFDQEEQCKILDDDKNGLWPKKVGKWPFLSEKVARKNGQKLLKNGVFRPKIGYFGAFLSVFEEKMMFLVKCPLFSLTFATKLKILL